MEEEGKERDEMGQKGGGGGKGEGIWNRIGRQRR